MSGVLSSSHLLSATEGQDPHIVWLRKPFIETGVPIPLDSISILSPTNLRYKQVRLASQGIPSGVTIAHNFAGLGLAGDAYVYIMN
jgi:hypothetical protein